MTVNEQESHCGMLAQACGTPTEFWCGATILPTTCHPEAASRGEGPRIAVDAFNRKGNVIGKERFLSGPRRIGNDKNGNANKRPPLVFVENRA